MHSPSASAPSGPTVIMGVAGSGKSTIATRVAQACGCPLIEGDDFHPPENVRKMSAGIALDDADRQGWLDRLGRELGAHREGAVLSCSALKRAYRDRLRAAAPGLRFVFLDVSPEIAQERVLSRSGSHFFPPSVVASQFATLEDPSAEPGVLRLDAALPPDVLAARAAAWIGAGSAAFIASNESTS